MASASNYLENAILDHILGGPDFTRPANVYVALHTADPGEAGSANTNEVAGSGYARVAVPNNGTSWPSSVLGVKSNGIEIDFGVVPAGGWGVVTHASISDSPSGVGNILFKETLNTPKTLEEGDPVKFGIGDFQIAAS